LDSDFKHRFIGNQKVLASVVRELKRKKQRIVLTQGVYDLIHEGHARYLEAAKALGDILIVGVDSDRLTRLRKGPNRPVVPQQERLKMLVHLRHVDIVTIRHAHHEIGDLIRLVRPDVLVTSFSTKDFTRKMKKDYDTYCGRIVTLAPQATTTTSARIRNLTIEGAEQLANEVQKLTQQFLSGIRESS
jgi:D-beta-D-heptose 7-phosphate kinase/D-beta-D-heptose 1-phosphate adenosyltransferase